MKLLVTNDDGVESPGLPPLVAAVAESGHDVVVVAPDRDMSGSAAAIGHLHVDKGIEATPVELDGLAGIPAHAVDGPPGLCVLAARLGGFGEPPDVVVSGINPGCNTGRAVLHSGTVGAALTAANFGCRGLAVSLDISTRKARGPAAEPQWATAAAVAGSVLDWLLEAPAATVLNVNVPNLPLDRLAGVRQAALAPFGTVRASVVEAAADGGQLQMELRPTERELPPGSDTALVAQGFVTVTPIAGIQAAALDVSPILDAVDAVAVDARSSA
jgi:5'-nucleotidase